jgi:hypothetical protein
MINGKLTGYNKDFSKCEHHWMGISIQTYNADAITMDHLHEMFSNLAIKFPKAKSSWVAPVGYTTTFTVPKNRPTQYNTSLRYHQGIVVTASQGVGLLPANIT